MFGEVRLVLKIVALGVILGFIVVVTVKRMGPDWCRAYTKFCMNRQWPLFLFGAVFFFSLSALCFVQQRFFLGIFHSLMTLLEVFVLFKYGFQTLTPELEKFIDEWDPFSSSPEK